VNIYYAEVKKNSYPMNQKELFYYIFIIVISQILDWEFYVCPLFMKILIITC